jgi:hypothetical protein
MEQLTSGYMRPRTCPIWTSSQSGAAVLFLVIYKPCLLIEAKANVKKQSHAPCPKSITSDPYAYVMLSGAMVASTRAIAK